MRTADVRAAAGAEFVPAYIIETEVPAGTPAEDIADYLTVTEIPALAAVADRVTSLSDLDGLVTDVALKPGEQLLTSRWVDPLALAARSEVALPEGMQAVTIALPVERVVGGSVLAGDTVGVLISAEARNTETGEKSFVTTQAFHKMLVLAVQPGTAFVAASDGSDQSGEPVNALMVTLAGVTPDIEILVWGQEFGSVWLTLEPPTANERGSRVVDGNVIFP